MASRLAATTSKVQNFREKKTELAKLFLKGSPLMKFDGRTDGRTDGRKQKMSPFFTFETVLEGLDHGRSRKSNRTGRIFFLRAQRRVDF